MLTLKQVPILDPQVLSFVTAGGDPSLLADIRVQLLLNTNLINLPKIDEKRLRGEPQPHPW
jgi:hypothetical protein